MILPFPFIFVPCGYILLTSYQSRDSFTLCSPFFSDVHIAVKMDSIQTSLIVKISEKAVNYLIQMDIVNSNTTALSPWCATIMFDFLMALYLGTIVPI